MVHITHTITQKDPECLRVVQLTDTHLFSSIHDSLLGVNTQQSLLDILEKCSAEHADADFFLVTGDIAQQQDKAIYERFFDIMNTLGKPYICLSGNHDANVHLVSETYPYSYADNQVIETQDWRFILLNSSFEDQPSGQLAESDLAWLKAFVAEHDDKQTIVCMHHHPIPMKSAWIDQHMLQDADCFWSILSGLDHIKAICFGHVHQAFDDIYEGIRVLASPSTSIQFKPLCDDFTIDVIPAGFRVFDLSADGKMTTSIKRLDSIPDSIEIDSEGY